MSASPALPPDDDGSALFISPRRLHARALALLALMAALLIGGAYYLLHIRGAFRTWQPLYLICEDSEGISVGMEMSFVGFPIGRVREIRPTRDKEGNVRARVHVNVDARAARHWLRTSSVFLLEKSIVGAARLRAITNVPDDPPLPAGSQRELLRGDLTAELPLLLAEARALLRNLEQLTAADSALAGALLDVQEITQRLAAPHQGGLLAALTGDAEDARRAAALIERTTRVLEGADTLLRRLGALTKNANAQVLGPKGLTRDAQTAMRQLHGLIGELRGSIKHIDAVLGDAKAISGNTRAATNDLHELREEVEANLQRAETLMNSLGRRWPFASGDKPGIKLP